MSRIPLLSIIGGVLAIVLAVSLFVVFGIWRNEKGSLPKQVKTEIFQQSPEGNEDLFVKPELIEQVPSSWETFVSEVLKFSIQYPPGSELDYGDTRDSHIRSDEDILEVLNVISVQRSGENFGLADPKAIKLLDEQFGENDDGSDSIFLTITLPKRTPTSKIDLWIHITVLWDEARPLLEEETAKVIQEFQGSDTRELLSQQWVNIGRIKGFEEIFWGWPEGRYWFPQKKYLWYVLYFADDAHPGMYYMISFPILPSEESLEAALKAYTICKKIVNSFQFVD